MLSSIIAQHGIQFATLNYGVGGQHLDDADSFKQMVNEELQAAGIDLNKKYFVKISAHPVIEGSLMITLPGGIIIAQSLYDSYQKQESDKYTIRFLVRHEAAHLKNHDIYKRVGFNVALCAALLYGSDYVINKAASNGYLPASLNNPDMKTIIKLLTTMWTGPLTNSICTYHQETCADKHACATPELAEGGARCFERLAQLSKKCGILENWIQNKSFLWRIITGYPTHENRAKMLHALAEQLKKKQDHTPIATKR
jgi:hypothetical protein